MEKLPDSTLQHRKFRDSLSGVGYLPLPHAFIRMLQDRILTPTEFTAAVAAWNFFQSPENRSEKYFTLSRSKLASKAMVGEKQAGATLSRLESIQVLIRKPGGPRDAKTFRWNVENLAAIGKGLYLTDTSVVSLGYKPCTPGNQPHVSVGYNVYITTLINTFKTSYTEAGDQNASPSGSSLPFEKVHDALRDAVVGNWLAAGNGGEYSLNDIMLLMFRHPMDFGRIKNPTSYFRTLLRDQSLMYELRKNFPDYHRTETETLRFLESINQRQLTQEVNQ